MFVVVSISATRAAEQVLVFGPFDSESAAVDYAAAQAKKFKEATWTVHEVRSPS